MSEVHSADSVYRCAECGNGKNLMAWASANVYGPLGTDGNLTEHHYIGDDDGVHEDSIQCSAHPDGVIERRIDGKWCRWWVCRWCLGDGHICDYGAVLPGGARTGAVHQGWRPAAEIEGLPLPGPLGAEHGHAFALVPGQPGYLATCRICASPASSRSGERPCRGDQHECPVPVTESAPGARQVYQGGWHCYQPGKMNGDFTAWTCEAGHVITRATHDHPRGKCAIPRGGKEGCPWADLAGGVLAGKGAA